MTKAKRKRHLLRGSAVYLSGPMDFVASRANEKKFGWRNRVAQFLARLGVTVFDPWNKPEIVGMLEYGREGVDTDQKRQTWTFAPGARGAQARAKCTGHFWQTMHIDLRMVDKSDFVVAYCPTNIYSVGTPHEIILCRQQRKPVLFVSPPVVFPALRDLRTHLQAATDRKGLRLLAQIEAEVPIKENQAGIPSLWYMPLVGPDNFFDGFGFAPYRKRFGWKTDIPIDRHEAEYRVQNPLLPYLEKLTAPPKKWSARVGRFLPHDDWLIFDTSAPRR
jgi:hypothetical protein